MPSKDLLDQSKAWQDEIEPFIALNPEKPNALPFAIDTHSASREFIYRVYDPRPPHEYLQDLIQREKHPFPFDYEINHDPQWEACNWHLNTLKQGKVEELPPTDELG